MEKKKNGFGTSIGFELATVGSAVGLGNIWGFPYKTSANGGAAFLFVYLLCIFLIGAVAMLAEFLIGRRAEANPVTAYKQLSPHLGFFGLLAVVIPVLIICYYYVLGGYTVRYTLSSFSGAPSFPVFAGNIGDVLLHTMIFALLGFSIIAAGVRGGIERTSKILLPTMLMSLILIICFSLSLGEGVRDGLRYYLKPDFSALTWSGVLTAMGQAFFSLSLGCGVMITYGSYTGRRVRLNHSVIMICLMDGILTFIVGLAIFPALFHYASVSGLSVLDLGSGGIGLIFITLPMVFKDMHAAGQILSLLFFGMTVIAALTSVISIVEVVTQYIIQRFRVYRTYAALGVTLACFAVSAAVAVSLGSSLNGGHTLQVFGRNLLELLDQMTNTVLMPFCALAACLCAGWKLNLKEELQSANALGFTGFMMKIVTPFLIILVEYFGLKDLIASGGAGVLVCACVVLLLTIIAYFAFSIRRDTGVNRYEADVDAEEAVRRKSGLKRGWHHKDEAV